ncbi:PAS domain-containing protein [Hymenobacter metallicola]|uniref:histidine kinase n=1 Tax=Hymenobacter metallicola TaxID=2563114 RepID=A0A4Z0QGW5_9BACT|nr:PAS domain-containing protein [Hymenobacter metallicola]TGE28569.1 PAS domain S-box protein [Hymenobacter metallicola]
MSAPLAPPDSLAAQLQQEQKRREQAEARVAALEQQLAEAQATAQRNHVLLASLAQNMRMGFMLVDDQGMVELVNQRYCELFGVENIPTPVSGMAVAARIQHNFQDPQGYLKRAGQVRANGESVLNEEIPLADGRVLERDYLVLDSVMAGRLVCYRDVTERYQREAQLRTVSLIAEQNPNPVLRLALDGELIYANPAAAPLVAELHTTPALRAQLLELVTTALTTANSQQQEISVGSQCFLLQVTPVPEQPYATLYLVDITARRQAEQQLAEQREFYEVILRELPVGVSVFDAQHRYLFANPAVLPNEAARQWLIGKTNAEVTAYRQRPAELAEQREQMFQWAIANRRDMQWEETVQDPSGTAHVLRRFHPIFNPDGSLRLLVAYGLDITARRQAEQQLAEQREFYEAILDELPVGVAVFDAQHRYLFANPGTISDDATRQWMIGKTNFEAMAYRQRPRAMAELRQHMFERAVQERRDVEWEETIEDQGNSHHLLRRFRPVFNADGSLRMMVSHGLDVTERYRAEQQLAEQREFYETILNELPADIGVFDTQHRYLFVNPVGIKNPEVRAWIIGKDHFEYCAYRQRPIELAEQRKQMFDEVIEQRRQVSHEETVQTPEGPRHLLRMMQPVFNPDGSVRLIVAYGLDITERHRAEQQIIEQQEFIRQIVDTSPNFLYVTNPAGMPTFTNVSFADALLRSHHEQTDLTADTPEAAELRQLATWNDVVIATRDEVSGEMPFTLATGEVRQLQVVKRPLLRPNGVLEVLTVCTDITELKRAKREAEAAATARENFLANMSHEIRTPMNGVLGMAGLLTRTPLSAQQQEYVSIIRNSGNHLLGLLNDILDVAKITSGKLELEQIPFDVNQTLQAVGQTLSFQATAKGLSFTINPVVAAQPFVLSDSQRLSQVLLNLLSNSLKFTERGGITLTARLLDETDDTLTINFLVADTGLGVAVDKQESIFSTFTQAYADTSRRFGGSGLGLSISSSLVAQLGGHLLMSSEPGQGTCFGFTLTFVKASAQAVREANPQENEQDLAQAVQDIRGLRVLLVEDHDVNRQLAQLVLESYDVAVETASDGASALALFEHHLYDVILMDIQMPGMNGLEATARIRQHPDESRAQTPIIALTANAFLADNEKYLAAGMNDCLAKPFEATELVRKILALHRSDPRPAPALFALDDLQRTARGNPAFVLRILQSFLTHTPAMVAQLQEAAAAADWPHAAALAHRIKPSLKLLMTQELLPMIATLEEPSASAEDRAQAAQHLNQLLPQLLWQVQHYVSNNQPTPA